MIAQRQRLREGARQRLEAAEMRDPLLVAEGVEPDARRPALVAMAQDVLRKGGRRDDVVEELAEVGVAGGRAVGAGGRHGLA